MAFYHQEREQKAFELFLLVYSTLQAEPFLTVHMLCKDKAERDERGSARGVSLQLQEKL